MTISSEGDVKQQVENVTKEIEQIKKIGEERLDDLRELGGQIRRRVEDEIKARPFVALGVAFGAGALVTSIVSSRLARLGILAAGGYAAREMFGDKLMDVLARDEEDEDSPRPKKNREKQPRSENR